MSSPILKNKELPELPLILSHTFYKKANDRQNNSNLLYYKSQILKIYFHLVYRNIPYMLLLKKNFHIFCTEKKLQI